eukprot:COSAG05_NODE_31_length_28416_cov_170.150652_22_plen_256_part_00
MRPSNSVQLPPVAAPLQPEREHNAAVRLDAADEGCRFQTAGRNTTQLSEQKSQHTECAPNPLPPPRARPTLTLPLVHTQEAMSDNGAHYTAEYNALAKADLLEAMTDLYVDQYNEWRASASVRVPELLDKIMHGLNEAYILKIDTMKALEKLVEELLETVANQGRQIQHAHFATLAQVASQQSQMQARDTAIEQLQTELDDKNMQIKRLTQTILAQKRQTTTWISQTCELLMYLDIGEAPRYLRRMKILVYSFLS